MVMIEAVIAQAKQQEKNILILSSARSGTHALGAEFKFRDPQIQNLGEICVMGRASPPHSEITKLFNTHSLSVAHIVQMIPKFFLSAQVDRIKQHTIIICLRRKNKVKQFASNYYFKHIHQGPWHNLAQTGFQGRPAQVVASEQDVLQFLQEQMIDDFFLPDFNFCYEDIHYNQTKIVPNEFPFPIEQIFSNLDYVQSNLGDWTYHHKHLL
jgi:hypothetical protein